MCANAQYFENTVVRNMPVRFTQVGALGYDPEYVRLPPDSVGVSASLP